MVTHVTERLTAFRRVLTDDTKGMKIHMLHIIEFNKTEVTVQFRIITVEWSQNL